MSALVMALATGSITQSASACGLEGGLGDAFSAAHEGSLDVAFATRDAIASGWLIPDPVLETEAAHDRADERLQMFAAGLPFARHGARPFAVLLVESGVWTRVSPKAGRWSLATHIEKPGSSETAVLTSEPALRKMVDGQLSADQALSNGVLTVRGDPAERDRLISTLRQVYPDRSAITAQR
ncbi:hypothetical protein [Dechloromonas denitrificans]|uniref:hypothetical protein n=1 Tax=Dechloromonas denitrificans TaxID=281362 RepID=UPI0012F9B3D5|nr:hypothetical protein [Dechloromonas denitrificans]